MTLRLDNIAPLSKEKRSLVSALGVLTDAPAFVVGPPKLSADEKAVIYPRAERITQARAMIDAGEKSDAKIAMACGLSKVQVIGVRAQNFRFK